MKKYSAFVENWGGGITTMNYNVTATSHSAARVAFRKMYREYIRRGGKLHVSAVR